MASKSNWVLTGYYDHMIAILVLLAPVVLALFTIWMERMEAAILHRNTSS